MFVIPSRARPHNIARLIRAWTDTGATAPALLRLDDDDASPGGYLALDRPSNWALVVAERRPLSVIYNEVFGAFPDEDWYGVFADDIVPETPGWDARLIETADRDGLAFGDDGINGADHATHFVVGGALVRSIGWLALPGLDRLYIDTVWTDIARDRGVLRYLPDVKITHWHPSVKKALFDPTYRKHHKQADHAVYRAWRDGKEHHA